MHKEEKEQLAKIMSLMERMDGHYTSREAEILQEAKVNRTDVASVNDQLIKLSSPEELVKTLSQERFSPRKGWYVTLGYIEKVDKLGKKDVAKTIDSFSDETAGKIRQNPDFKHLNSLLDNPSFVEKGVNKGKIRNPFRPDSYTNYIVEASVLRLMYGRNEVYAQRKELVKQDLEKYMQDNPEMVQQYMDDYNNDPRNVKAGRTMIDFPNQTFDDMRNSKAVKVPNTNIYKKPDDYEFRFNTPQKVYQKLHSKFFLITDEETIEEISKEEAQAYMELYGVESEHKVADPESIAYKVKKVIEDTKKKHFNGDVWTQYNLRSVFLLNFTPEDDTVQKLQYYNPNAIISFLEGRELKSGTIPTRFTKQGVFEPYLRDLKQ